MRNRRGLLVAAIALGLSTLPMARSVRADPPSAAPAAGSTPPAAAAAATGKKKAPAPPHAPPPARARPTKPAPATKDVAPKRTPETGALTEAAAKPRPGGAPSAGHEVVEHESRIEFDERMVRGQSAAGAIFLFQRTPSELKSIVEVPETFRPKTVELLLPRDTP